MKNKKLLLAAGGLIIVLLVGGLVLNNKPTTPTATPSVQEQSIPSISAKDIGLTLDPGYDKQRVVMTVTKTDDLAVLNYELSYTSKGGIPRGAIGTIPIKNSGKAVVQEIPLGTCSDVCHYDKDVSNIKLVLKVTKTDGKVYQAETTTNL